jgi:regulator of nonsense transcripts 3
LADFHQNTPPPAPKPGFFTVMGTPQLLSKKTNGGSLTQSSADAPTAPKVKAPMQGEKVVVRRLPPGMTEEEFVTILGDEWAVGHGRVDWFSYWPGKVSKQ